MNQYPRIGILLTALLVVVSGWGITYLVMKGIELSQPSVIMVRTTPQDALALEARVVNPAYDASHPTDSTQLTLIMGGDVMFDRGIRAIGERNGYDTLIAPEITALFKQADIVAVNLEGPIASQQSKTLVNGKTTDSFTFTSALAGAQALQNAGVTIVSLANNHIDNFGFAGYIETQKHLNEAGISWFGNPWNSTSSSMSIRSDLDNDSPITTRITKNGITVAFIGYHAFQTGIDRVVAEIRRVAAPNVFVVVMPHWGEEYVKAPSEKMRSQARAFVAAGADAIIGAHPHVIMDQEWVGTVPVYYSLGNLLFDQYFSTDVMTGLVVELHLSNASDRIQLEHISTHTITLNVKRGVTLEK